MFEADQGLTACKVEVEENLYMKREMGREARMLDGALEDSRRAGFLLGATTPQPFSWR